MSALNNVLANLSFSKFEYHTIFPTALEQLDHLFLVIGNGYEYDPVRGPIDDNGVGLLEPQQHNFEKATSYNDKKESEMFEHLDSLLSSFEDVEVPEAIRKMVMDSKAEYTAPEYKMMDEVYYFNPEVVAAESIANTTAEQLKRRGGGAHWRTPYPISEYSFISKVRSTDDPVLIQLALCIAKSWQIVLDYYVENGLYLTQEQIEAVQPSTAYYQSHEYMTKTHAELSAIINELEKSHD